MDSDTRSPDRAVSKPGLTLRLHERLSRIRNRKAYTVCGGVVLPDKEPAGEEPAGGEGGTAAKPTDNTVLAVRANSSKRVLTAPK